MKILENKVEQLKMEYDALQRKMSKREGEIEQLKFERDEYRAQGKNLNNEIKNLKAANQILDRKLKAEQAERMSMSNASYISNWIVLRLSKH